MTIQVTKRSLYYHSDKFSKNQQIFIFYEEIVSNN